MGTVCCECDPNSPPLRQYQFPLPAGPYGPNGYGAGGQFGGIVQSPFTNSRPINAGPLPSVSTSLGVAEPPLIPTSNHLQLQQPAGPSNPLRASQLIAQEASGFVLNVQDPEGTNLRASRIVEDHVVPGQTYVPGFRGMPETPVESVAESLATIEKTGVQESGLVVGTRTLNGVTYRGQWKGDLRHGMGIQTWPDGSVYQGYWVEGVAAGFGKYRFPNGDVYQGQFKKDMANGKGVLTKADGTTVDGSWWDDVQHGSCREVYPDGSKFEGKYTKGKRNGQGRYVWPNGTQYTGNWTDGLATGNGRAYWADGRTYDGDWYSNRKHGYGIHFWPDGRKYQGKYQNDIREGAGDMTLPNGQVYKGEWSRGRRHGKGMEVKDGNVKQGRWNNGVFSN